MEKIDNIVVENLNEMFGQELKGVFVKLHHDADDYDFTSTLASDDYERYYGIVDGVFANYSLREIRGYGNVKILSINELKELLPKYPKQMYCSNNPITKKSTLLEPCTVLAEFVHDNKTYYLYTRENWTTPQVGQHIAPLDFFDESIDVTLEEIAQWKKCKVSQLNIIK